MTDDNKFFRYLWRFNAVVLACLSVAAGVAIFFDLVRPWRTPEVEPAGNFAPIPHNAETDYTYRLESRGESRLIGHENLIALNRWKGAPETYGLQHQDISSSAIYASARSVNLLAVNEDTADSHWIFRGYDRAIVANDAIYSSIPATSLNSQSSAIALVMTIVDEDTNKDGELSEKDRQSLYIYRSGATEAVRLFTADLVISARQTASDRYTAIYENGNSAVAVTYSVPDFKMIAEKPLPKVPSR